MMKQTVEHQRLTEKYSEPVRPWRKWGPYVSDRSWGTVREDYSPWGNAWDYLPHDLARSKAYRWGEDAIAGICDRYRSEERRVGKGVDLGGRRIIKKKNNTKTE